MYCQYQTVEAAIFASMAAQNRRIKVSECEDADVKRERIYSNYAGWTVLRAVVTDSGGTHVKLGHLRFFELVPQSARYHIHRHVVHHGPRVARQRRLKNKKFRDPCTAVTSFRDEFREIYGVKNHFSRATFQSLLFGVDRAESFSRFLIRCHFVKSREH